MDHTPSALQEVPWLLLDVDGVLNAFGDYGKLQHRGYLRTYLARDQEGHYTLPLTPADYQRQKRRLRRRAPSSQDPWALPLTVRGGVGEELLALQEEGLYRLAWCTAWGEEANQGLRALVGLPLLPVVPLPPSLGAPLPGTKTLHWKTEALSSWLGEAPAVWVDDEVRPQDEALLQEKAPRGLRRTLRIPSGAGLLPEHLDILRGWSEEAQGGRLQAL